MTSTNNKRPAGLSLWLMIAFSGLLSSCIFRWDFQKQDAAGEMPYKNERALTGKMLYARGDYYYYKATRTHYWQGAPETNMDEMEQAGNYYRRAFTTGYRPKTGYDSLRQYYYTVGDYKKQEAGFTALLQAYPDSIKYWYDRAINRQQQKNYQGALQDLNKVLKPGSNFKELEDAYFRRGAVKYMLNPKDTADAEADRIAAQKLTKPSTPLITYHDYCSFWK